MGRKCVFNCCWWWGDVVGIVIHKASVPAAWRCWYYSYSGKHCKLSWWWWLGQVCHLESACLPASSYCVPVPDWAFDTKSYSMSSVCAFWLLLLNCHSVYVFSLHMYFHLHVTLSFYQGSVACFLLERWQGRLTELIHLCHFQNLIRIDSFSVGHNFCYTHFVI